MSMLRIRAMMMASLPLLSLHNPNPILPIHFSLFPPSKSNKIRSKPLSVSATSLELNLPSISDRDLKPYLSCSMPEKRLRVAVLLSGGVDSSIALRLLHAAGHSCTAFYLKIWFQVISISSSSSWFWIEAESFGPFGCTCIPKCQSLELWAVWQSIERYLYQYYDIAFWKWLRNWKQQL